MTFASASVRTIDVFGHALILRFVLVLLSLVGAVHFAAHINSMPNLVDSVKRTSYDPPVSPIYMPGPEAPIEGTFDGDGSGSGPYAGGSRGTLRTPTATSTPTPTPSITTTPLPEAIVLDIDVDSDNTNELSSPDRSQAEDDIEESFPGKIIIHHTYDSDYDGVPDFADGILDIPGVSDAPIWNGTTERYDAGIRLTPIAISIAGDPGPAASIRFVAQGCEPNDPMSISFEPAAPPRYSLTLDGDTECFRLWKRNGDEVRRPQAILDGGDLIPIDREIPLSLLLSGGNTTLYLEAVDGAPSLKLSGLLSPDPTIDLSPQSVLSDTVAFTILSLEFLDVQTWGPEWIENVEGGYGEGSLQFNSASPIGSYLSNGMAPLYPRVGGAITDGASLVFMRVQHYDLYPGDLLDRVALFVDPASVADPSNVNRPSVYGGLLRWSNGSGALSIPELPMRIESPEALGFKRAEYLDRGGLFYVPPRNFITRESLAPAAYDGRAIAPSRTDEVAHLRIKVRLQDSLPPSPPKELGSAPFRLRKPPLVLVHGLFGSARNYWGAEWESSQISTRVYYADYEASNMKGYDANLPSVVGAVREALESYRIARDISGSSSNRAERSFRGVHYAATRVDTVGHSMGGQVVRTFLSDLNGRWPREHALGWPDILIDRTQQSSKYFSSENLGVGYIRRFISVGSPFRGSPFGNLANSLFAPQSNISNLIIGIAAGDPIVERALINLRVLARDHHNASVFYTTPTAFSDLSSDSAMEGLLRYAQYPSGLKAVPWFPISTIVSTSENAHRHTNIQSALYDILIPNVLSNPQIGPVVSSLAAPQLRLLVPSISDFMVLGFSQRNAELDRAIDTYDLTSPADRTALSEGIGRNAKIGRRFGSIAHSDSVLRFLPGGANPSVPIQTQTKAGNISLFVGDLLMSSDDLPRDGRVTGFGPGGSWQLTGLGQ